MSLYLLINKNMYSETLELNAYSEFDSIRFDSIRFVSIRFDSFRFDWFRFGSIDFDSIRFVSIRFDWFRFDSIRFDSIRFGSKSSISSEERNRIFNFFLPFFQIFMIRFGRTESNRTINRTKRTKKKQIQKFYFD